MAVDDEWDLSQPGTSWGAPLNPVNPFVPEAPAAPEPPAPPRPAPPRPAPPRPAPPRPAPPPPPPLPLPPSPVQQAPLGPTVGGGYVAANPTHAYNPARPPIPAPPPEVGRRWSPTPSVGSPRPARKSPTGCSPVVVLVFIVVVAGVVTVLGRGQSGSSDGGSTSSGAPTTSIDPALEADLYSQFDPSNWTITAGPSGPVVPNRAPELAVLAVGRISISSQYHVVRASLSDPSQVDWSKDVSSQADAPSVAVAGGIAYVKGEDQLQAFDWQTGALRWSASADPAERVVLAADDRVVVASSTGVRALASTGGVQLWERPIDELDTLQAVGGWLLLRDTGSMRSDLIVTVDLATGKDLRSVSPSCPGGAPPGLVRSRFAAVADSGDVLIVPEEADGCVVRWSPSTGDVRWRAKATNGFGTSLGGDSFPADGRHLVLPSGDGVVRVVDLASGGQRVVAPGAGEQYRPAVVRDGLLYVYVTRPGAARATAVRAIDLATGRPRWSFDLPAGTTAAGPDTYGPDSAGNLPSATLFAGDEGIRLYRVESGTPAHLRAERVDPATGRRRLISTTVLAADGSPTVQVRGFRDGVATLVIGKQQVVLVPAVPQAGAFPPG